MNIQPQLLVFDLDGTLANSKQATTLHMGILLEKLLERIPLAIMSGGRWEQFQTQLLPALPSTAHLQDLYLFPTSGAACYRFDTVWKLQYQERFSDTERNTVLIAIQDILREAGYIETSSGWGPIVEDRGSQISISCLGQNAPLQAKRVWDPDKKKREALQQKLLEKLPFFSIKIGGMTTVDITKNGIDKAYGIKKLSEMSGIPVSKMLYMGDALEEGGNDAVVIQTGIPTQLVANPEETAQYIQTILIA